MPKIYVYLTYAGALPFIICVMLLAFDIDTLPLLGAVTEIISAYGLVIATFMAGSLWGQHLHLQGRWKTWLPLLSNIITIILWITFLILNFNILLVFFIVIFLLLLWVDYRLLLAQAIEQSYFKTRCVVTIIVVITLAIAGVVT